MKRIKGIVFRVTAVIALAIVLMQAGCSDDDSTNPKPTPPSLPPQSAFIMDFGDFEASRSPELMAASEPGSKEHWSQSALRVAFWNLALTVTLAVPVAAFAESFNHQPTQLPDGSWQWSYTVTVVVPYTCRLVGSVDNNRVYWEMYITKQAEYTDYLWYSGDHNLAATEGSWIINREPSQTNPFLQVDWQRDLSSGTGELKYTNIVPGDEQNGGYINYGSTAGSTYDRFYHLYNKAESNLTEIEWNYTSKAGRVKDARFYGDTEWHCWNEQLDDITCP